ncbi:LysR family transcriptional regulator [Dactylosporangium sp. CA-092794]|uniref:LysR family transcriptional regulator n=1 Tax=Dactylosporangium sp. CA-092794 TaxID=3239929 RepID=UPI003D8DCD09
MAELDLRQLRYFAVAAEERNLTRAAERLMMTQPALSRAIQALERTLGVDLLIRRPRSLDLTAAGRSLLESARDLEKRTDAAVRNARAASQPHLTVSIHICDVALAADLCAFDGTLEFVTDDLRKQPEGLRVAQHDVALLRDHIDEPGIEQRLLLTEPRTVLLSVGHPLAAQEVIALADLRDEPIPTWPNMTEADAAHWAGADQDGRAWRRGPEVTKPSDVLAVLRLGQAVAFYPASVAPPNVTIPGLVARAVDGVSRSRLTAACRTGNRSPDAAYFIDRLLKETGAA